MLYDTKNPHGGDIYARPIRLDYSANINPYGTPAGVLAAVEAALPGVHHYPDPFCRELVTAISRSEQVSRDCILCGNGAAELIYAYARGVQPAKALELAPTFSEYALALEQTGCHMSRYDLGRDFILDEGFLSFMEQEKPDAVFLCNPNNPTGRTIDPPLLRQILALARRLGARLFLDECFLDLSDAGQTMVPLLEEWPELLILRAFTKSYGMAGLRLGYCMSSDRALLHRMSALVQPWNVSTLAQAAGIAALKEQDFLKKARETIFSQRQWLSGQLARLGFRVCPSQTNFILFQAPVGLDLRLLEQGIAIRSCANYHGLEPGWYRIAVKLPEENRQLVAAMAQIMERKSLWQKTL